MFAKCTGSGGGEVDTGTVAVAVLATVVDVDGEAAGFVSVSVLSPTGCTSGVYFGQLGRVCPCSPQ